MNNEELDDLKQYISASISQSEGRMLQEVKAVRQEMAGGFLAAGEAIEEIHQQLEAQHTKDEAVNKRLTKLEQRMA